MATAPDGREDFIQVRRDVSADWESVNPVLGDGEPGWDSTSKTLKVGDGTTAWDALTPAADPAGTAAAEVAALDELRSTNDITIGTDTPGFIDPTVNAYGSKTNLGTIASSTATASPASLLVAPFTVGATAGLQTVVNLQAVANVTNNSGSPVDMTFRLKLGTAVVGTWVFSAVASSAASRIIDLRAFFTFIDFIGTRISGSGSIAISSVSVAPTGFSGVVVPTDAIDLTVQFSASHANTSIGVATAFATTSSIP